MIFGKKTHLIGLDIGSRGLKASEIIETKKGYTLKNFGAAKILPGIIDEGVIKEPEKLADAIRQLFKAFNFKEENVAISIGGYSAIVKRIDVQKMTENQLQETIHLEAEQHIPFDIKDVFLDFQILGENQSNPNQMHVLLVAAKKEIINDYADVVQLAGLNPCLVDVDAFALQNSFELNYDLSEESVALIDIGASKTLINVVKNGDSLFLRDVSSGCGQIDQKIASAVNCSLEEAGDLKICENSDVISQEDVGQIVLSIANDWCLEIRRALDFFYSTNHDEHIERIVLSGGGANIKEFREILAEETAAAVETINPFRKFDIDRQIDPAYLEQMAPQAAICAGLAIRSIDDK
ncbi:MAG: type IV pilus assembly protein PilM [Desulfobacterales bacterium]|nr:type IV pilus assembly protein PilM [Desulfobacterales bacterium]